MRVPILYTILTAVLCFSLMMQSCNRPSGCDSCDLFDAPDSLYLEVNVTLNNDNPYVPIAIYKGDFDDGNIVLMDTLYLDQTFYYLPASTRYSVTAEYMRNDGGMVIAVDGDRTSYTSVKDCDYDCWQDDEASVDLELD